MGSKTLGRYIPYNSAIHRMDPRYKIIALLFVIVSIFLVKNILVFSVFGVFIFMILIASKIPLKTLLGFVKSMFLIIIILFILNCFTIKDDMGKVFWSTLQFGSKPAKFKISIGSIEATVLIFMRIFLMVITTTILTATTKPLDLMIGLEDLMAPLKIIKFPTTVVSMIIAIALRFIPTLLADAQRIMQAQASRGVDFENGKISEKFKALVTLIIPLFLSAFSKAYDLADALEARGYNVLATRTRYRSFNVRFTDVLYLLIIISCFATVIFFSFFANQDFVGLSLPHWYNQLTPHRG